MAEPVLEQRVDRLEDLMAELLRESAQTRVEMRAFKDEMREFKDEMRADREAMRADREAMRADTQAYREESRREIRDMRRQWGELSNRLGTMVEDLVLPSIPRILRTVVDCPEERIESMAVRVYRRSSLDPGRGRELDAVAVCGEHVLVNETKGRLAPADVDGFLERLAAVREYLPEAAGKKVIGAIASLYVDASLARYAEKRGLIVVGFGEDVMDVLNSPGFVPQAF